MQKQNGEIAHGPIMPPREIQEIAPDLAFAMQQQIGQ
jgi:hypothetical protein